MARQHAKQQWDELQAPGHGFPQATLDDARGRIKQLYRLARRDLSGEDRHVILASRVFTLPCHRGCPDVRDSRNLLLASVPHRALRRVVSWESRMQRDKTALNQPAIQRSRPTELTRGEPKLELLRELVAHLRQNRTLLLEEWVARIAEAKLLTAMTQEEIFAEATLVYDSYFAALETGTFEALQAYARNLSERIIPRGVETHEVVGIVLLLRDVLARSLFAKYQADYEKLNRILDAFEPAANRVANTVAVGFVQERERVIRQQQEAIRELSTPVLQVRERLLILPIIGVIDPMRARQLTEQLLRGIRTNRAKVVVIDITGVAAMDVTVANHLVQTVEASRLLGATVIVTGLSPEIAQTLVTIGVDLGKMNTVGDLQGGIEQAERLLGYKVMALAEPN